MGILPRVLSAFILVLLVALGAQTMRLGAAQRQHAALGASIAKAKTDSVLRGALTGQEALSTYVRDSKKDAPVVERVVTRLRNVCLRQPAADLPVPEGAGGADGPGRGAGDLQDREFAEAAGRDLAACKDELNKLKGLRRFVRDNGG